MTPTTATYMLLRAFADELARCGMQAACTSPGSRSAPLVLTLANEPRLRCYSHVDERAAGFFALGLAKASGLPVAVACTSGTAAAQLLAPAVEAREARVPLLLILTADRPAELRENGAGQAIDQIKLFGSAAKWFAEVAVHEAGEQQLRWMRTLACRAYACALEGRPGAVHLNFPLREPLVLEEALAPDATARADGAPFVRRRPAALAGGEELERLRGRVEVARRGVLVAGRHERPTPLGEAAAEFTRAAGWPLLADPLSGARRGEAALAHYDALLRDAGWAASLRPDLVLRVGDLPVSKPLRGWLAGLGDVPQLALDPEGAWQDPSCALSESLALEPAAALSSLTPRRSEANWLPHWLGADKLAGEAIAGVLAQSGLSEPVVAAELAALLGGPGTLFVASSMPVRDIETFWAVAAAEPPRVLCNRGANGIDGTVSSAFGVSACGDAAVAGGPVVLLIGDVALAHDLGGLLAAGRLGLDLTIVLLNNDGGGIFDFLPVASAAMGRVPSSRAGDGEDVYTRHVATETGLDFARAAELYGLRHTRADDVGGFRAALHREMSRPGSAIVEVRTERAANVALHRQVWGAVAAALSRSAAAAAPAA